MTARPLILAASLLLAGCDIAALMADPKVAQREADAKAIGGACRLSQRSLESCFAMNEKASKAAVFAGWKEMDQYMRENKIDAAEPQAGAEAPKPDAAKEDQGDHPTDDKEKPAADPKGDAKGDAKGDSKAEAKPKDTKPKAKPKAAE
jgi:hypothetical protein